MKLTKIFDGDYATLVSYEHKEVLRGMAIKQYNNLPKMTIPKGHSIFKINIETGDISLADYTATIEKDKYNHPFKKFTLNHEVDYIYFIALNIPNAIKRFEKVMIFVDATVMMNKRKKDAELTASSPLQGGSEQIENKS